MSSAGVFMVTRVNAKKAGAPASHPVMDAVTDAIAGTLGLHGERMSKVDTAWLRMDDAANLMMIVGVWVVRPGIRYEDLAQRLQERLLQYPRFTQKAVEDSAGASWIKDPHFDLARHLVTEKLPKKPKGQEQAGLQERLGQLCMQPLDRQHPLWQFHLVPDYRGGSAIMVRIHHCIADGIALISVTQSLVDGGAPPPVRHHAPGEEHDWLAEHVFKPLTQMSIKAMHVAGDNAVRSLGVMLDPQKSMEDGLHSSADMAKLAYHVLSDAAALALMPNDSPTRLKGKPGHTKRVAWCAPLPLADVQAVGKALGCSINDVLLSCVAGAIGQYLQGHGDATAGLEIRAMIPVNLRPLDKAYQLGNKFGLVPLVLPIGIDNPVERLLEVRQRMRALKGSTQPLMAYAVLGLAGLMLKPVQQAIMGLFTSKTTAVMTNVPGPREKLKICGSIIEETLFWVPQSGTVGLGVSILSYGGGVQFGVVADATLCPDPQAIIDHFEPEFDKLAWLALMLPWGDE
jgi:diacylglycerol O-acyltransferase